MDLSDLVNNVADATIYWESEEVKIRYRPGIVTIERIEKFERGGTGVEEDVNDFLDFLVELLESWDITSGGEQLPISRDGFKKVPLPFLRAVLTGLLEDAHSGEAGSSSVSGFRPGGSLASVPTGTQSSRPAAITAAEGPGSF